MRVWLKRRRQIQISFARAASLCRRIVISQLKNKMPNAIPAATGMMRSSSAGDFPSHNKRQPVTKSKPAVEQRDFRPAAGQRPDARAPAASPTKTIVTRNGRSSRRLPGVLRCNNCTQKSAQHEKADRAEDQAGSVKADQFQLFAQRVAVSAGWNDM